MSEHLRANGHSSAATLIASDSNSQPELPICYLSGYGVKLQFATNGYAGDMGSVLLGWYETSIRHKWLRWRYAGDMGSVLLGWYKTNKRNFLYIPSGSLHGIYAIIFAQCSY